jgi:hypothetical protein
MAKPKLKTLQDIIDYRTVYSIDKYAEVSKTKGGVSFINRNIFDEYYGLIKPYIQRVTVLDAHSIYNCNPALLSRALYDTPDLDWVLLKINNMTPYTFIVKDKINYIALEDMVDIFDLLVTKKIG